MEMRLRFPELLKEHDKTAYAIAKASKGRIQATTLYRLVRNEGRVRLLDTELLEALADVLKVESLDELLEREGKRKR